MANWSNPLWKRAMLVVVSVGLSLVLSVLFPSIFVNPPNVLLLGAVLFCARYGGREAGFACAVVGAAASLFLQGSHVGLRLDVSALIRAILFVILSRIVIYAYSAARRAGREAAERRDWLNISLKSIGDAVIATDMGGNVTLMNPAAERLTGWKSAEAMGLPLERIFRMIDEESHQPVDSAVAQVLRAGAVVELAQQTAIIDRNGRQIPVEDSAAPIRGRDGQLRGVILVFHDVTRQRQTLAYTQRLQALTSALSSAVTPEQVADVVVQAGLTTMRGHLAGVAILSDDGQTVTYINHIGRSANLTRSFTTVSVNTPAPMTTAIHTGDAQWIETRADFAARYSNLEDVLSDAPPICSIATIPLRVDNKVVGGMTLAFPVEHAFSPDERTFLLALAEQCALALERARLYQAEQQARRDAEAADQQKLNFLALIAHELRTPLASIKGFATTLLAEDITIDQPTQHSFVQIINEEADRLTDLTEQLLDLSRLQAGTLRINREPVAFEMIVQTAMAQFETLTKAHQLVIHLPPDLPKVMADTRRIAQVLVNLVGNAAKFAPEHSQIVLTAAVPDDMMRVEVSDSGPGIPPEARQYVFDLFRQGESESADYKGVGLGLAICRRLVQEHGGDIWIEGRAETGTTIAFTLPLASAPKALSALRAS